MAGNAFQGMSSNETPSGAINAPLSYSSVNPPKEYHGQARGKKLFSVQMQSTGFKNIMRELGMTGVGRPSADPIEVVIYNDASRKPSPTEKAAKYKKRTFYAKFIEYGFTWMGHYLDDGTWIKGDGRWVPGKRMFARLRKWIKRELIRNFKQMSHRGVVGRFTRASIHEALVKTAEETVKRLIDMTPEDTGRMKDSWKIKK
jgi:hypothetical protein